MFLDTFLLFIFLYDYQSSDVSELSVYHCDNGYSLFRKGDGKVLEYDGTDGYIVSVLLNFMVCHITLGASERWKPSSQVWLKISPR